MNEYSSVFIDWRLQTLPRHEIGNWSILRNGREINYPSCAEALSALSKWQPGQNVYAASPSNNKYLTPIQIDEFYVPLKHAARRQAWLGIILLAVVSVVMLVFTVIHPSKATVGFVLAMLIATVIRWYDSFISMNSANAVADRALFFAWLRNEKRIRNIFIASFIFLVAIGCAQLVLQLNQTLAEVVSIYGASYIKLRNFELWRLISGPFFHGSLLHFASNAIYFISVAPIALFYFRMWAFAAFFVANAVGAELQMLFGTNAFDAYLGISPGIFCLAILVSVPNAFGINLLPKGIPSIFIAIVAISLISAEAVAKNSATIAHLAGIGVGSFFAIVWILITSHTRLPKATRTL